MLNEEEFLQVKYMTNVIRPLSHTDYLIIFRKATQNWHI